MDAIKPNNKTTKDTKISRLRIILLSVAGILFVFMTSLAVIAWKINDSDYQRLLIRAVDVFSDYRLAINGSFHFNLSMTPSLSASGIELRSKSSDVSVLIGKLDFRTLMRPLLSNTVVVKHLALEKVLVDVRHQYDDTSWESINLTARLPVIIPEYVKISDLEVLFADPRSTFEITKMVIDKKNEKGLLLIDGSGNLNGESYGIQGTLGAISELFYGVKPIPVDVKVVSEHNMCSVRGTIANLFDEGDLTISYDCEVQAFSQVMDLQLPSPLKITGSGKLKGNIHAASLSNLHLLVSHDETVRIRADGMIGNLFTQEHTDIRLSGFIKNPNLLGSVFSGNLPAFDGFNFTAKLRKSNDDIELKEIVATLSDPLGLTIELSGVAQMASLDPRAPFKALDLQARFASSTTAAAKPLLVDILPEMGPVQGKARITAVGENLAVEDIEVLIGSKRPIQLSATGRIGQVPIDPDIPNSEISLDLSLKASHTSTLGTLFEFSLPNVGPVSIDSRIIGSSQKITVDEIKILAGNPKVFSFQADGSFLIDRSKVRFPLQNTDLIIQVSAPSVRTASRLFAAELPNLGSLKGSMRLQGRGAVLTGKDIRLMIGHRDSFLLKTEGSISKIPISAKPIEGIYLASTIHTQNTALLSKLIEQPNLPDLGPIKGNFRIQGSTELLEVSDISFRGGSFKGLDLSAKGKIKGIAIKPDLDFHGVDIDIAANTPNTSVLSPLVGHEIPDLGPLTAHARMEDHKGKLRIPRLDVSTGEHNHPTIKMTGSIDHLMAWKDIELNIRFDETLLSKLFSHRVPDLGRLNGKIHISDADGTIGIEKLELETLDTEEFKIKLHGGFDDLIHGGDMDFYTELFVRNPATFGKRFDKNLPALAAIQASGHLNGNNEKARFSGSVTIGNTEINSNLSLSYNKKTPEISGHVSVPILHLRDFGIKANADSIAASRSSKASTDPNAPLFSQSALPLDTLKKVDLDLSIGINEIVGAEYAIDRMDMKLVQKQGILRIKPLNFVFSGGQVVMDAEFDARTDPQMAVNIRGDDLNLRGLLQQVHKPAPIEGDLHLLVDIKSKGRSPHDIASNLNGEVGLALENGKIRRRELDLLFLDLVGWLFTYGITKNETDISCAITQYKIENGVVDTKLFYIDGPKLAARGEGHIDLSSETIDMVINVEKKKLFFNSRTPIRIRGKMADPTVTAIPLRQGILLAGGYIFAPYVLIPATSLGALWSLVDEGSRGDTPCLQQIELAQ